MASIDIAQAVERGITTQSDLITSLSIAVIGGLLALLVQLKIHNASRTGNKITLRWFCLYYAALLFAGLSIVLGYVLSGMLIQVSPQLFNHTYEVGKSFMNQNITTAPIWALGYISLAQFLVFLISIAMGVGFTLKNRP